MERFRMGQLANGAWCVWQNREGGVNVALPTREEAERLVEVLKSRANEDFDLPAHLLGKLYPQMDEEDCANWNFTEAEALAHDLLLDGMSHIDASYGGEDSTAFTCAKRDGDMLYMYGKIWHAHVDTVMDAILADTERLRCYPIYCENNADKGYLKKELFRRGVFSTGYDEKQNKYVKIATFLRKWWDNILWHPDTDPEYLEEIMDYTIQAAHDDAPDSASCCCRILDKGLY